MLLRFSLADTVSGMDYSVSAEVYRERCKCLIPRVSIPDWTIAFKRSDNRKLWIRDDVISLRYQVSCELCSKQVFISRPDVVSLASAIDA